MKCSLAFLFILLPFCMSAKEGAAHSNLQSKSSFSFIENKGQIIDQNGKQRKDIDFKLEAGGMTMFIGDGQLHYQWFRQHEASQTNTMPVEIYRLDIELLGTNPNTEIITGEQQEYYENYYLPQCPDGATAHSYKKITYKNVYPNIDCEILTSPNPSERGGLKYNFIVKEGGNYKDIRVQYKGTTKLELINGSLVATTPFGSITENVPYTYFADSKVEIKSNFVLNGNTLTYNVNIPAERHGEAYTIDPILTWATYYGGTGSDADTFTRIVGTATTNRSADRFLRNDVATDLQGFIYYAGGSQSNSNIATTGAYQVSLFADWDGFFVKLNSSGQRQWASYYGGNAYDGFSSLVADATGNIYLGGHTTSNGMATTGAYQTINRSGFDGFIAKFNTSGQRLWATYFGGNDTDRLYTLCLDGSNLYAGGATYSDSFISTTGSYQPSKTLSGHNGWVAKFTTSGTLQWATYYGGGVNSNEIYTLTCDAAGSLYVGGWGGSGGGLGTTGTFQPSYALNVCAGFVAKFSSAGQPLWCSYYYSNHPTGTTQENITRIACDHSGNIYIGGQSGFVSWTNMYTTGAFFTGPVVGAFGFLAKFNASNGTRLWATLLPMATLLGGMGVDISDNVYICGSVSSTSTSPSLATSGAYQGSIAGGVREAFLMQFDPGGTLKYGTYYGGTGTDDFTGLALDEYNGGIVLGGYTSSTSGVATTGAHQTIYGGNTDGLIVKFGLDTTVYISQPFTDTLFCAGDSVHINYGVNSKFSNGNVFTLQLSDASGSFASPVNIGSRTDTIAGIIHGHLPISIAGGIGYRMRIVSTSPSRTSFNNSVDIHIKPVAAGHSASSNSPICGSTTLSLFGNTTSSGVGFIWSGPGSYTSSSQNPIRPNSNTAYSGDYIVTMTYNGCMVKDTTTVLVKPLPAKPVATSNTALCPGFTLNLTASSTTSGISWGWTGPNGFLSSAQNPIRSSMTASDAGDYIVTATLNGCSTKDTETVVVYPVTPKPIAGNNSPLCVSNTLNLTASTVAGATYSWGGPAAFTAGTQNPTRTNMQLNMAGKYYVIATANGCLSEADSTTVTVNPAPTINLYANPKDTVCAGSSVTLVALVTNGGSGPSYQWYKNGNPIGGAISPSYVASGLNNGDVFYCQFTPGGGTGCNGTINSGSITITVLPFTNPSVTITASPDTNIWQGLNVTFTATANNCSKPTYQWKHNNADVGGATINTWGAATLADNDQVSCVMTCNDPCPNPKDATSNKLTIHVAANAEALGVSVLGVSIYPNPVSNELTIEGASKGAKIQLFDVLGRKVYHGVISSAKQTVNTSALVAGTYVLHLTSTTGGRVMYKVVKE